MKKYSNGLILYFGLAYLISWLIWAPYYAASLFPEGWNYNPVFHYAGSFGPLIAAFLSSYILEGKQGAAGLFKSLGKSGSAWFLAAAAFLPFVILIISGAISYFADGLPFSFAGLGSSRETPDMSLPVFIAVNIFVIGFGEETGWRGFALPRIQSGMNALQSSLLLALFWAIWHWPLFFYPLSGFYTMSGPIIFGWLFSLALGSVLQTWLFNSSRGSVLVCALFHGTMDVAFTSEFTNANLTNYNGMLITILGVVIVFWMKPKNLSLVERTKKS